MENKSQRFKRIAESRTNRILEQLRLLGNCSNENNYSYTEEDVKKIFNAIENEVKIVKSRFAASSNKSKFSL